MRSIEVEAKRKLAAPRAKADRTAKRAAWDALQAHCPEFIPDVRRMAELFGIVGVSVEAGGEVVAWGDTEAHDHA